MEKQRITVQVLNGDTGEFREVVATVTAQSEQHATEMLFAKARRDDFYYRFLGMHGVLDPANGKPVTHNNQTYWAPE
jgi:hypothetical protein